MDAHTEAATHIGHIGIAVDAAQQSETVDDKNIGTGESRVVRVLRERRVAHDLTSCEQFPNLLQVVLANDVRGNDDLPVGMVVEPGDKDFLVGLPAATSDKHFGTLATRRSLLTSHLQELLYQRQLSGSILNLQHTVEAGVTHNGHIVNANGGQQLLADVVLHIEPGEALQHMGVLTTIPAEEHLSGTEDAADAIDGNAPMLQDMQVVVPKLILDEERHHGTDGAQEATGIGDGVKGQVADDVGSLVVLAYLVA